MMTNLEKQIEEKLKAVEKKRIEWEEAKSLEDEASKEYFDFRRKIEAEIKALKARDATERYGVYLGKYFVADENYSWIILGKIESVNEYNPEQFVFSGFRLEIKKEDTWDFSIDHFTRNTVNISDITYNKKARLITEEEVDQILSEYQNHFLICAKGF